VTVTVALSVLLHGVSSSPLASRYGAYAARLGANGGALFDDVAPVATRSMGWRRSPLGGSGGGHGGRGGPPEEASE
jgi:hypothetical protein